LTSERHAYRTIRHSSLIIRHYQKEAPVAHPTHAEPAGSGPAAPRRWVCHCTTPPTLLATVENGKVNLKVRDRYYHIEGVNGRLRAICPRCGQEHILALEGE
ncbi:MAG: hypothetical protein ACTHMR_12850, partial [Thermomicrobiales bacterium]